MKVAAASSLFTQLVVLLVARHPASGFGTPCRGPSVDRTRVSPRRCRTSCRTSSRITSMTTTNMESCESSTEVSSEVTSTSSPLSWRDDGFVYGLAGSNLQRPTGKVASIVVDGDSLETQPYQQVLVASTLIFHAVVSACSVAALWHGDGTHTGLAAAFVGTLVPTLVVTTLSWILADFGSGVLHWSVDNYGNGRTPVMGSIIAAFQGHHSAPWTITQRGFCNNVYKLCTPFGFVPLLLLVGHALGTSMVVSSTTFLDAVHQSWGVGTLFLSTFCVWELLSQEFHKWSHQLPRESPWFVPALQRYGLTIRRAPHALHHTAPYEGKYCIVSGVCNRWLDESGFFRRLEYLIYTHWTGVEANAWKLDADLRERTVRREFGLPLPSQRDNV